MVFKKSNKVGRMVVVPYQAHYKKKFTAAIVVVLLGSFLAGMYYGQGNILSSQGDLGLKKEQLEAELVASAETIEGLKAQVARLKLSSDVDRSSAEKVRQDFRDLSESIAELEEAVAFYKGVLDPDKNKQGLSFTNIDISGSGTAHHYRYKLMVMQLAGKRSVLKGKLNFNVVGVEGDKAVSLPLHKLSPEVETENIKLRFKYFQEISGEMILPENFTPQRIEVVAISAGRHSVTVEQKYDWSVQES